MSCMYIIYPLERPFPAFFLKSQGDLAQWIIQNSMNQEIFWFSKISSVATLVRNGTVGVHGFNPIARVLVEGRFGFGGIFEDGLEDG